MTSEPRKAGGPTPHVNLRNPWIDPRISQVRPDQVETYLASRGWKRLGSASNPHLIPYEREGEEDAPTVFVPAEVTEGAEVQWLIEAIEELARFEQRWAVAVLEDVRQAAQVPKGNGAAAEAG